MVSLDIDSYNVYPILYNGLPVHILFIDARNF